MQYAICNAREREKGEREMAVKRATKTKVKKAGGRPKVAARDGVLKTTLDNGLTVVVQENTNAPVATFWCWYKVGSRHERSGITGISHWVEHMLFKGTKTFQWLMPVNPDQIGRAHV